MEVPEDSNHDFVKFMAYALSEYMSSHIVFTSPGMQELFGEVIEV